MGQTIAIIVLIDVLLLCIFYSIAMSPKPVEPERKFRGFIIIGYQGVGKSTLASLDPIYVDLESSSFKIDGKRDDNWYITYCQIALQLAESGHIVLTSSHKEVREYFESQYHTRKPRIDVYVCFPSPSLEGYWKDKLKRRYMLTESSKDFAAWKNADDRYLDNIDELRSMKVPHIMIENKDYDLHHFMKSLIEEHKMPAIK